MPVNFYEIGRKYTWTVIDTKFFNHYDEKSLHVALILIPRYLFRTFLLV